MNGVLAPLQNAFGTVRPQVSALWNVLSAIAANQPLPARNVVLYTLALGVILFVALKLIRLAK